MLATDSQFSDPEISWAPPDFLVELAADDSGLITELLDAFRTDTRVRLDCLRTALLQVDMAGVRRSAHSIKGAAMQLGAERVAAVCREMELVPADTPVALLQRSLDRLEQYFEAVCRAMEDYPQTLRH